MTYFLLFIFIAVPVAEIAIFIQVGDLIGFWPTLGTIILTAVIGTAMIRQQGLRTLARAQRAFEDGRMPVDEVVDGVCLLVSALLLLTPGFLTDGVGFVLLVRPVRMALAKWAWQHVLASGHFSVVHPGRHDQTPSGPIIEGEVIDPERTGKRGGEREIEHTKSDLDKKSPWRDRST